MSKTNSLWGAPRIHGELLKLGIDVSQATVAKYMGINQVLTTPRSPWQTPYVEHLIGSIRRECLDHIIAINEEALRATLRSYFSYYHDSRCHLSLDKDSPYTREVQPPEKGTVVEIAKVGGLHHRYERRAA